MSLLHFFKKKPVESLIAPPLPLPQRNELCWCGSGDKYKKCHLEKDQETLWLIKEQENAQKERRSRFN